MKIGGSSGGDFEHPPEGQHVAVLAHVYDIGVQIGEWQGKEKRTQECAFVWELEATDSSGEPFTLVDTLASSTHNKANLTDILAAVTKRPRSDFVGEEVDIDDLIGKCAMLSVAHGRKGSAYIDRVDALQLEKTLSVQGSYGEGSEIHALVAWHMGRAVTGTVPGGQGVMPEPKGETKRDRVRAPTDGPGPDYDDIPF